MNWTEERVSALKKLWVEGLSASQIAKQLGGVTRNAVIGKVHRLGLAGRATPSRPAKRPRPAQARPRLATSAPTVQRQRTAPSAPTHLMLVPALEPVRGEDGAVTTVLTLNDRVCKWPIGDPCDADFAFCGRGVNEGPYCVTHARQAFQPQQPRRKRAYGKPDELRRMLRLASM
jgi:GcrA cell cycle regulator